MAIQSIADRRNVSGPPVGGHPIQRHARLAALQHEVTSAAIGALTFDSALKQALPGICSVFGWPAAHAFVMSERECILVPAGTWHFEDPSQLQCLASVRAEPLAFNPGSNELAVTSLDASDAPLANLAREIGLSHVIDLAVPAGPYPGGLIEFFSAGPVELLPDEREALISMAIHLGQVLERERHISALLRNEAKFRALFESNAVPMYFWNSDKLILDANDALLRLIGFTREEVLRGEVNCADITPADQQHKDTEAIEQLRRTGYCQPYEKNWIRRDGTVLSVVLGGALLPGSDDLGTAIAIDVTELRQTASTLRESERRYQLATSAASVSIWELDLNTGMVYSDGVLSELLGYPRDEKIPHGMWTSRIHSRDRRRVRRHEEAVLASRERLPDGTTPIPPIEFRILNKQRRVHWFLNRGLLLRDAEGKLYRATGAITEITEQKRVQDELNKSQGQLRVAYRQVRTLTGRLVRAQEEERMRVAREIHDDLGQRLASLGISLEHIRRCSPGNDELFVRAEREVDELAKAIRDLSHNLHSAVLEHAGLEAGVKSLAEELRTFGKLDIDVIFSQIPDTIPSEISLAAYRIIQEGLRNVQKHSGADRARVSVACTGSRLLLQVHDDGRGFSVWNKNGKSGLGLISAQERARLVGGRFLVSSTPGRGTHLCAILPMQPGVPNEAA